MSSSNRTRFVDADEPTLPRPPLSLWTRPDTPEPPPLAATPPTLDDRVEAHRPHPLAPVVQPTPPLWQRRVWLGFLVGGLVGTGVVVAVFLALALLSPSTAGDPGAALGAAWDHLAGLLDGEPPAGIEPTGVPAPTGG